MTWCIQQFGKPELLKVMRCRFKKKNIKIRHMQWEIGARLHTFDVYVIL